MKRIWILLFIIALALFPGVGPRYARADSDSLDVQSTEEPHLVIPNYRQMPVFKAGEKATFYVPIENTTHAPAKNLVVSLAVSDLDKFPFRTDKMSFTCNIFSLTDNTLAGFDVIVPSTMKAGIYPISVNITYTTAAGGGGSISATVYVKIENDYQQPKLTIQNTVIDGGKLHNGKTSRVNLMVKNNSDLALNNVELHLSGFSTNGLNLDNWPDTQYIKSMKPQETMAIEFQINADPEIKTGTYPLDFNLKYHDEYDQEYTRDGKVYLPVLGKGSSDDMTPRVLIDNYTYGGDYARAGQVFPLTISLINTSQEEAVSNIKVSLNSDGQVFSPVGNSNSFYIPRLEPGSRIEKTIHLKPKEKAENQNYVINADIDYQDENGNKLNEKEVISVPVYQDTRLFTSDVTVPPGAVVGNPVAISLDYHNAGKALISNLSIRTTGDFTTEDANEYVGNLEAGKGDYYDATIIPAKPGSLTGKIILEYDDDQGRHYQQEKVFKLVVNQPPPPPPAQSGPVSPKKNKLPFKKWMIPAGFVILALAASVVYRKRRKAKEEVDFDE